MRQIKDHVFERPGARYPWDKWTNGEQWVITRNEDYAISTHNLQISLHGRTRAQKMRVRTNSFKRREPDSGGYMQDVEGLIFQFFSDNGASE